MNTFVPLLLTAMISLATSAGGQDKQLEVPQAVEGKHADPSSNPFSGTGTLFQ